MSNQEDACAISEEGTSTSLDTNSYATLGQLPPWRAECILSKCRSNHKSIAAGDKINQNWRICETDWWTTDDRDNKMLEIQKNTNSTTTTGEREQKRSKRTSSTTEKQFFNMGLHVWNESRSKWTRGSTHVYTAKTNSSCSDSSVTDTTTLHNRKLLNPSSSQYRELMMGLTNVTREYMLPMTMNLADLINVYVDIWENSHE